ncbi:MAG: phosphoribosylanthranilate isomerase [Planctomycetes bacterium]|nr:phosphoribosylanthranilate isomerase [Planctomycetota bacterium]
MFVKICGLTRPQDARFAIERGASVIGMVTRVPESPRNNNLENLKKIAAEVDCCRVALLYRNSTPEEIISDLRCLRPGIIHLCGNENTGFREILRRFCPKVSIWQSLGYPLDQEPGEEWDLRLRELLSDLTVDQAVIDCSLGGKTGGTGNPLPFSSLAGRLGSRAERVVLAGGISPENICELVAHISPLGIDASSGVESAPGIKDPARMGELIDQVLKHGQA